MIINQATSMAFKTAIVMCLLSCWALTAAVSSGQLQLSLMKFDLRFNNRISVENTTFNCSARSILDCAKKCAKHGGCWSFTFAPAQKSVFMTSSSGSCCGYSSPVRSANTISDVARGSRTYVLSSGWLEKPCSTNADCPAVNKTECYQGLCLCTPGYFFSHSRSLCLDTCQQLSHPARYLRYPTGSLLDNNMHVSLSTHSAQGCQEWCTATSGCVTVDYKTSTNFCALAQVTPLDVPEAWVQEDDPEWELYQRTCA